MSVKLELYRVFKEVAEAGNITAAAQALYISQSAVSQSIKQLEGELQTRLFARNSRGVALTPEGRMLYEYVRSAIGRRGEAVPEPGAADGTPDHRRQRHRHQPVPAAVSGSIPPAVSRHPHPDRFRPQPQGTGPAAIRQGGYCLCQHPPGVRLAGDAPLLRHPLRVRGGGGLSLRLRPFCRKYFSRYSREEALRSKRIRGKAAISARE